MSLAKNNTVTGEFITFKGERFYAIRSVDQMEPFLISIVSDSDHWLFISSTGGLTAGRVSPETALFPYITVDKIYESTLHTGSKTLISISQGDDRQEWEPFNQEHNGRYSTTRNLFKNLLGNKLCFEEINHDLELAFRYCWLTSDTYGFVRECELENLGQNSCTVEMVDGLQNILPADTPRYAQTNVSSLVDAYKWSELDEETGLAFFTLYSGITDRAEPCESLKATTVFCLGLEQRRILLSARQLDNFRRCIPLRQETRQRGIRGAYLVNTTLELPPGTVRCWQLVAGIQQTQAQATGLRHQLGDPATLEAAITRSVAQGANGLAHIMARADAFQATAGETVSLHHYANALFNILRGGIFVDQYKIPAGDLIRTIRTFNHEVFRRNTGLLRKLPETIDHGELLAAISAQDDLQLMRLANEYLPITFGRRHGDPSRPWNQFSIRLKDARGNRLLSYEGNWRDIFQNWEALVFSYPEYIESVIAKFVNASTVDGYNPYRITKQGIDWEVEDPDDPWSYIGYWGDHQIIYLLKLLELSNQFHPARLGELLRQPIYSYANVPYRIKPFADLVEDAKNSIVYDRELELRIEQRLSDMGADGKLLLDADGEVYQVNLLEKLLVTLLAKLGNLVIDGGIWLNTQRPEWNDANNALVGQGLSMVTLYYMRRYVGFLRQLLAQEAESFTLSREVSQWLAETAAVLRGVCPQLQESAVSSKLRFEALEMLGQAASRYRQAVYRRGSFSGKVTQPLPPVTDMLNDALAVIDHSIRCNRREDGLYHAYNLLHWKPDAVEVDSLYLMLEGQVAALSSGAIPPAQAIELLGQLFESDIYRTDQHSFMLYPDRQLAGFLEKNQIPAGQLDSIPLLRRMLEDEEVSIVERDDDGCYRFNADFRNAGDLAAQLDTLSTRYGDELEQARRPILALYEQVFNHKAFTGRSGGMFGFEGLGCIYWHMVSKLLLAVQENYFAALAQGEDAGTCQRLGQCYYRVRAGLGFNKTPGEYGAFPADPYSHTPRHAGAQQPGMTGQVKEEILTRFGELGVRVSEGMVRLEPGLLRAREFVAGPQTFRYLDVDDQWQELTVPESGLAFTWCQVPFVYHLQDADAATITIVLDDGERQTLEQPVLPADLSTELFRRSGRIRRIELDVNENRLFHE